MVDSDFCLKSSLKNFNVALDKGTYDAISLSPEHSVTKRNNYKKNISKLINSNGYLIISSCNWTEEELKIFFTDSKFCKVFTVS